MNLSIPATAAELTEWLRGATGDEIEFVGAASVSAGLTYEIVAIGQDANGVRHKMVFTQCRADWGAYAAGEIARVYACESVWENPKTRGMRANQRERSAENGK